MLFHFPDPIALGGTPALTGSFRLSNASAIIVRNQNDNGDFNVIQFDASANMTIGDVGMPNLNFVAADNVSISAELTLGKNSLNAFRVRDESSVEIFRVDTTNTLVRLNSAAPLEWSTDLKVFRDGPWELAIRDGLNENYFHIYKTFTDASNYERLRIAGGGPAPRFDLFAQSAGTGGANMDIGINSQGASSFVHIVADVKELQFGQNALRILPSGGMSFVGPSLITLQTTAANGLAQTTIQFAMQLSGTLSSGSTFTFTNIIPAGALLLGITTRIVTSLVGPTSIDIGDGTDVDRWGAAEGVLAANQTSIADYTTSALQTFQVGQDVVITANGGDFTAGEIRCVAHFIILTGPAA